MALTCDGQGQIPIIDIIEAVNTNEADISGLDSDLGSLEVRVGDNENNIVSNTTRITTLENNSVSDGDLSAIDARVTVNEGNIAVNTSDISINAGNISTNQSDIATNTAAILDLDTRLITAEADIVSHESSIQNFGPRISQNETDIAALQAAVGAGKYAVLAHEAATGVNGGTPTLGWDARDISTLRQNSLAGTLNGTTSYKIPEDGVYKITGSAIADGAYHQSRVFAGGQIIYGSSEKGYGDSVVVGVLSLLANEDVAIQTRVNTPAVGDLGLGESTPFGETNVYVQLQIEKVG